MIYMKDKLSNSKGNIGCTQSRISGIVEAEQL